MHEPRRFTPLFALLLALLLYASATAQSDATYDLPEPVILTAAGQSADASLVQASLARIDVQATIDNELEAGDLTDVGTLVLVIGGSQKGLGAAGVDVDGELARVDALLAEAEANDIAVIGMHVGGEARRGALSEPFIDAVAGEVPVLIVTEDGNQDGYFDEVVAASGADLRLVGNVIEAGSAFQALRTDEP